MIHIEKDFYTQALNEALAEDTPEEREMFKRMIFEYGKRRNTHENDSPIKVLDQARLKWFKNLTDPTVEFARLLDLNLLMTVQEDLRGYIQFETSYFKIDDKDGTLPMPFWSLLVAAADRTSITHYDEVFRIELFFDLYRLEESD